MNKRIALVVGGTGLIGNHLLKALLKNNSYEKVIALVRKPLAINNPKLKEVIVNFENLDQVSLPQNIDDAFCCLGTTMKKAGSKEAFYKVDYTYVLNFSQLATKYNVQKLQVISAMGAKANSFIYYNKVKGKTEEALAKLNIPTLNIFQPSLLLGERNEARAGEDFGKILDRFFSPIIPLKYKGIQGEKVASFMIKKALDSNNKGIHRFTSDQMQG